MSETTGAGPAGGPAAHTDADTYVIRLGPALTEPLRSLAVGACLAIDTVMKQKDSA